MNIKEFKIQLMNQTSDGGMVEITMGSRDEVNLNMVGGRDPNRRDCRVDIKELIKAARMMELAILEL